ncbi:MAG: hypothetical protein S4CHLAM6_08590 [Chlamydiae bacterium]|nr:hypothetical protein [Chlamydiota bacterium]
MGKVDRRQMKIIQKKALKEVKQQQKMPKTSSQKAGQKKMIMAVHDQMDELLHTDAIVYRDLEKHKHVRVPKIRRISHRVK